MVEENGYRFQNKVPRQRGRSVDWQRVATRSSPKAGRCHQRRDGAKAEASRRAEIDPTAACRRVHAGDIALAGVSRRSRRETAID